MGYRKCCQPYRHWPAIYLADYILHIPIKAIKDRRHAQTKLISLIPTRRVDLPVPFCCQMRKYSRGAAMTKGDNAASVCN
jgi:hypothetical protein